MNMLPRSCANAFARFVSTASVLMLITTAAVSMAQSPPSTYAASSRFMWIWNSAAAIANTGTARTDLFAFCAAPFNQPARRITHLYLYAHQQVTGSPVQLRQFLADAHAQGITVFYLDGEHTWAESSSQRTYGEQVLSNVLAFNSSALPNERFDGIQYDVEPYALPQWGTLKATYWNHFVTLLTNCQAQVNNWNAKNGASLTFEACIPRWYDSDSDAITSSEQVQDITDSIAIMDYVNTASRIIADATTEVSYADFLGKKAVVGVETMQVDPATSTFFGKTNEDMERELTQVTDAFAPVAGFGGLAIHHYDSYRVMAPGTVSSQPTADLAASLTASVAVPVMKKPFTYTATAFNYGASAADGFSLKLAVPTGFTINSVSASVGTVATAGQVVTCSVASVPAGGSVHLTVQVTPNTTGTATATAEARSTTLDPVAGNNSAALSLRVAKK